MPNYFDPSQMANPGQPDLSLLGNAQPNFSFGQRVQNAVRPLLGNQDLAFALLANSGYSPQKRSLGEIFGTSALQANQMGQQRQDDAFKRQLQMMQMQRMQQGADVFGAVNPSQFTPESLAKFSKTKNYGDLERVPREIQQLGDPNIVRQYKFRETLTPEQQRVFDDQLRQNYKEQAVGGAEGVTHLSAQPTFAPLSTPQQEIAFAGNKKAAEAQAGAIGAGQGAIQAGIQTKGNAAKTVLSMLDEADKLIDNSTGSIGGAGVDIGAAALGKATEGAKNIARLKVIQTGLMLNMPRMEGPQSDADVALYRQAAASVGDPTVPRETRKAALETIRYLQNQNAKRASQPFQLTPGAKPVTPNSTGGWSIAPAD